MESLFIINISPRTKIGDPMGKPLRILPFLQNLGCLILAKSNDTIFNFPMLT